MPAQARASKTRERLLEAARKLFHRQGVPNTTLHDVAEAAEVPLGNVYYHFKTRDQLAAAVIEARAAEIRELFAQVRCHQDPRERLRALLRDSEAHQDLLTENGCPYASLAQDLTKAHNPLAGEAGKLLRLYVEFAAEQFKLLGKNNPRDLAEQLVIGLQGGYLLANTTGSPALLERQIKRLHEWVNEQ